MFGVLSLELVFLVVFVGALPADVFLSVVSELDVDVVGALRGVVFAESEGALS